MKKILQNDWSPLLEPEFEKPYYMDLRRFLAEEYSGHTVYPDMYDIFNALHLTPYEAVKVLIVGQDPYHGPGQAHGLCFSVLPGVKKPPSLQNIFKELHGDLGCGIPEHGCLTHWARQGVLMLNTVLTVRQHTPNSHKGKGWEIFTDKVIAAVSAKETPVVFILWGSHAQAKMDLIDTDKHAVIRSPHPSPFSAHRGFFGSRPFSKTNAYLKSFGREEIDWAIPLEASPRNDRQAGGSA